MSGRDRQRYLTETVLDQEFLDWSQDNLENRLEMVVDIETPTGFIYASDRNKYVGGTFYEALLVFPTITRTVGEWLTPEIQFSNLTIELSNADGRYNHFLPGGVDYGSWIGKSVEVKLGLAETASTYKTVFRGKITDVGGLKRTIKSIVISARDNYDSLSLNFPTHTVSRADFPKVQDDIAGKLKPVVYGDYTVATAPEPAIIPAFVVNGRDPFVTFKDVDLDVDPSLDLITSLNHCLDNDDPIQFKTSGTLPAPLSTSTTYYVVNRTTDTFQVATTMGGGAINITDTGAGSHTFSADPAAAHENIQLLISDNDLLSLDQTNIWMKRSDVYYNIPTSEITSVGAGNKTFQVLQNTATLWVLGAAYTYESGDLFFVKCQGKDLGAYSDNLVWQARDILLSYTTLSSGDFDANWATYRDKSTPSQSAISTIKSRVWTQEPVSVIQYTLSMLEQVRLEAFIDRDLKLKLNSLHFEDFDAAPSFVVKNWDVVQNTFVPQLDERNNFNRAQGTFDFHPDRNDNAKNSAIYHNSASITQVGKTISKRIVFPNLYIQSDVENQVKEILKMASALFETINVNLTWRAMLLDIGDFVYIDVQIGSSVFSNVPAMIRDIGYDPLGLKIPVKLWSMQVLPFPGYVPGYAGTVGGYNATLVQE